MKHLEEVWHKIISREHDVFFGITFSNGILDDFIQLHVFGLQIFHLQIPSYDHLAFIKHLYHVGGDAQERFQRSLESKEATL